jgi:Rrf2 family protein
MLSNSAEYALKAVLYIAGTPGDQPVRAAQVADELQIPGNYLSKILHELARAGLLQSFRGRTGGFILSRSPDDITLGEVVSCFDRITQPGGLCLLSRSGCDANNPCSAHGRWSSVQATVQDFFENTKISHLRGAGNVGPIGITRK